MHLPTLSLLLISAVLVGEMHAASVQSPPAMAAGVTKRLWEMSDMVDVLEAWETAN
jgi:hypothetical protein